MIGLGPAAFSLEGCVWAFLSLPCRSRHFSTVNNDLGVQASPRFIYRSMPKMFLRNDLQCGSSKEEGRWIYSMLLARPLISEICHFGHFPLQTVTVPWRFSLHIIYWPFSERSFLISLPACCMALFHLQVFRVSSFLCELCASGCILLRGQVSPVKETLTARIRWNNNS